MSGQDAFQQRAHWDPKRAVAIAALQAVGLVGIFFVDDVMAGSVPWNSAVPVFVIVFLIRFAWLRHSRKGDRRP